MIYSFVVYNIYFFLSVLFAFISEKIKAIKSFALFLSFFFIVSLCGLRYNVGTDYESYVTIFDNIKLDNFVIIEPGYYFLNKIFLKFDFGYYFVFFTCSFVTYFILFYTLSREKILSLGLFFTFTFGFVFLSNNIIRQGLVIPIFFYSIQFIHDKKLASYFITIIFCSLFHYSAILLMPIYWIWNFNIKQKSWAAIISLCFLLSFSNFYKSYIIKLISLAPKYSGYLLSGGEEHSAIKSGMTMIVVYLLNLFIIFNYKHVKSNSKFKLYYNLYLSGISISFLTMNISFLFRFSYYLTSLIIIILPLMIQNMNYNNKKYFYCFIVIISLVFLFKALVFNDHGCSPYNSLILWKK